METEVDEHYRLLRANGFPRDTANVIFYYPLLVLEGPLYQALESARGLVVRPADHLQYRTETWVAQQRQAYHIDVITESYLPNYLKSVYKPRLNSLSIRLQGEAGRPPVRREIPVR